MVDGLSIIIPAYNEEESIFETFEELLQSVPAMVSNFEIVVVDDGSTDKTSEVVKDITQTYPSVRLLRNGVNQGKGSALVRGFSNATFEWILMIDADGQIPISALPEFLNASNQHDMVIGYRIKRSHSLLRKISSEVFSHLVILALGIKVRDFNCPFKLFKKNLINNLVFNSRGFLIDVELLLKTMEKGCRLKEIGVISRPRQRGRSTIKIRHSLEAIGEIISLRRNRG